MESEWKKKKKFHLLFREKNAEKITSDNLWKNLRVLPDDNDFSDRISFLDLHIGEWVKDEREIKALHP